MTLYSVPVYLEQTQTTEHFEVEAQDEAYAMAAATIAALDKYGPQVHTHIRERARVIAHEDVAVAF
jgi:hypothetical protein